MAITISKSQIQAALPKIAVGMNQYLWLQRQVEKGGKFYNDSEFQRKYNHFYRVRRGQDWRNIYYSLMGKAIDEQLPFETVINHIYTETGRVEASFASKLFATANPTFPVIDSVVYGNLGLITPGPNHPDRIKVICQQYEILTNIFNDYLTKEEGINLIAEFDMAYPYVKDRLTNQKKLDLVLWQNR